MTNCLSYCHLKFRCVSFFLSIRFTRWFMDEIDCIFVIVMQNRFDRYVIHAFPLPFDKNLKLDEEPRRRWWTLKFFLEKCCLDLVSRECHPFPCLWSADRIPTVRSIYSKRRRIRHGVKYYNYATGFTFNLNKSNLIRK